MEHIVFTSIIGILCCMILSYIVRSIYRSIKEKRRIRAGYLPGTVFTIEEGKFRELLFKELGVTPKNGSDGWYDVTYQGGMFLFHFSENNRMIYISFPNFAECSNEELESFLFVINTLNERYIWKCHASETQNESPIVAHCTYSHIPQGTVKQCAEHLRNIMGGPFEIQREFHAIFDNKKEVRDKSYNRTYKDAMHKIHFTLSRNESLKFKTILEQENADSTISIANLLALTKDIDLGELVKVRIVSDCSVTEHRDLNEVLVCNMRDLVIKDAEPADRVTILLDFEKESLTIDLRLKDDASTPKTVFYSLALVRNCNEIQSKQNDSPISFTFHTTVEFALEGEVENYAEFEYMLNEAKEKSASGNVNGLTTEQRMALALLENDAAQNAYWGLKHYFNNNLLQALVHLKKVYASVTFDLQDYRNEINHNYYSICMFIGYIYMELGMPDTAFHYLEIASLPGMPKSDEMLMRCIYELNDIRSASILNAIRERCAQSMDQCEETREDIITLDMMAHRYQVVMSIRNGDLIITKNHLHEMIERGEDVEFAQQQLDFIELLEKLSNNKQTL